MMLSSLLTKSETDPTPWVGSEAQPIDLARRLRYTSFWEAVSSARMSFLAAIVFTIIQALLGIGGIQKITWNGIGVVTLASVQNTLGLSQEAISCISRSTIVIPPTRIVSCSVLPGPWQVFVTTGSSVPRGQKLDVADLSACPRPDNSTLAEVLAYTKASTTPRKSSFWRLLKVCYEAIGPTTSVLLLKAAFHLIQEGGLGFIALLNPRVVYLGMGRDHPQLLSPRPKSNLKFFFYRIVPWTYALLISPSFGIGVLYNRMIESSRQDLENRQLPNCQVINRIPLTARLDSFDSETYWWSAFIISIIFLIPVSFSVRQSLRPKNLRHLTPPEFWHR
jgi:hypothetical protein